MLTIDPEKSLLLVIDFQTRLMPAIHEADIAVNNAGRLLRAAKILDIERLYTEQNARGLGPTIEDLDTEPGRLVAKQSFDACREPGFLQKIPEAAHVVVVGCEAHVCVLQTVLGLVDAGRKTFVSGDALGSRSAGNRDAAIRRMQSHGAEIVTTEMVVFEWLRTADHPRFRDAVALIK